MNEDHRRHLEQTNGGNWLADCSCGWSGGAYTSRRVAAAAHTAHLDGTPGPERIKPTFVFGGPVVGQ